MARVLRPDLPPKGVLRYQAQSEDTWTCIFGIDAPGEFLPDRCPARRFPWGRRLPRWRRLARRRRIHGGGHGVTAVVGGRAAVAGTVAGEDIGMEAGAADGAAFTSAIPTPVPTAPIPIGTAAIRTLTMAILMPMRTPMPLTATPIRPTHTAPTAHTAILGAPIRPRAPLQERLPARRSGVPWLISTTWALELRSEAPSAPSQGPGLPAAPARVQRRSASNSGLIPMPRRPE